MRFVDRIVIHCSATPPTMNIGVNTIRGWHVNERGWTDVGYHYVVLRNGSIQEGRDVHRTGSHAYGYNKTSIGVCYIGGVDKDMQPEDNRTESQKDSLYRLINRLMRMYPDIKYVCGHRDLPGVTKACPSFDVKEWLNEEDNKGNADRCVAKGKGSERI
jgi:N-acetyl-anhydromuramyl-L-alanine amidase AmpD